MLKALGELLDRSFGRASARPETDRAHAIKLATATLLVELIRADYEVSTQETAAVQQLLGEFFELPPDEVVLLLEEAKQQADHAASLQNFTRRLHEEFTLEEKQAVIEMLWRAALIDKRLDKHEDHFVRKVAGLLYIRHSELIQLRNRVKEEARKASR
jgi:uncharacterized tellurite resistance protein B-like protein